MNIFFWSQVVEVYRQVFSVLKKIPTIWIPFILVGVLDFIALTLLFLAPSPPVSYVLAPIIERLWSPRFLHYPNNFLLLPKLFHYAHLLIISVVGVFVTGLAIKRIEAEKTRGEKLPTAVAAKSVSKHYFSIFAAWVIAYVIFTFILKLVLPLLPHKIFVQTAASFVLGLAIQALLGFLLPAIMILEEGFLKGLWSGFVFGCKNWWMAILLISVPMLAVTLLSFAKLLTPYLVRSYPEGVLWILSVGIVFSVVADLLVTSATTILFLNGRSHS